MTRGITDCRRRDRRRGGAGARRVAGRRTGEMSIEALLIVLMAGTEVFRPLRDLRAVLHQGMVGQSAAAGINALLAAEPLVPRAAAGRTRGDRPLVPTIAFDDVHFAYPGGRGAAHDGLSFTVAAGEKIGIVGPSGSGKSSVARLLLRLFDPQSRQRCGSAATICATLDPEALRRDDRRRASGHLPVPRHGRGESAARQARRDRKPSSKRRRATPTRTSSSGAAARLRDDASASAASICRAGSASAWRSPAHCCAMRRS